MLKCCVSYARVPRLCHPRPTCTCAAVDPAPVPAAAGPRPRPPRPIAGPLPAPGGRRALDRARARLSVGSGRRVAFPCSVFARGMAHACAPDAVRGAAGRTGRGTVGLRIGPDQRNASRNDDRTRRVCAERLIKSLA